MPDRPWRDPVDECIAAFEAQIAREGVEVEPTLPLVVRRDFVAPADTGDALADLISRAVTSGDWAQYVAVVCGRCGHTSEGQGFGLFAITCRNCGKVYRPGVL